MATITISIPVQRALLIFSYALCVLSILSSTYRADLAIIPALITIYLITNQQFDTTGLLIPGLVILSYIPDIIFLIDAFKPWHRYMYGIIVGFCSVFTKVLFLLAYVILAKSNQTTSGNKVENESVEYSPVIVTQ